MDRNSLGNRYCILLVVMLNSHCMSCLKSFPDGNQTIMTEHAGSRTLSVSAHLRGGKGDCAWQHTQLFRQDLSDIRNYPFEMKVKLKKDEK